MYLKRKKKRKKKDHRLLMGPFLAPTDETCQEPFPPFCLHQTFSDQQRSTVCCVGTGAEKGLLCSPAPSGQRGGHHHTNRPFAWKSCKILYQRSRWKIRLQKFFRVRAVQRAGWMHAACGTPLSPALHWVQLVHGDLLCPPRGLASHGLG